MLAEETFDAVVNLNEKSTSSGGNAIIAQKKITEAVEDICDNCDSCVSSYALMIVWDYNLFSLVRVSNLMEIVSGHSNLNLPDCYWFDNDSNIYLVVICFSLFVVTTLLIT